MKKSKINQERDFLKKSHRKVEILESLLIIVAPNTREEKYDNYSLDQFCRDDTI